MSQPIERNTSQRSAFQQVLGLVLSVYPGPDEQKDPQNKALYDEIVTRCVADVAGILQSGHKDDSVKQFWFAGGSGGRQGYDTRPGSKLNAMFKVIAADKGEEKAREFVLSNLASFTKGIVYTPHPTELLNEHAIEAQDALMQQLIKMPVHFRAKSAYLDSGTRAGLHDALKHLSETIVQPVSKQLTIDQEMRRSIAFSQRQFDSIPGMADTILKATNSSSSADLGYDQLRHFSRLLVPETWSPGDQDSKPDMTVDKLEKGVQLNQRAMMFHYYRTLSSLSAQPGLSAEEERSVHHVMRRLLKTGSDAYDPPKPLTAELAKSKLLGVSEADIGANGGGTDFSRRFASLADTPSFKKFTQAGFAGDIKPYANAGEFLEDLKQLREMKGIRHIRDQKRASITVVDSLIIQAMNFGDAALRVQVRQNAEMHREVLDTVLGLMGKDSFVKSVQTGLHDEQDSRQVERLITEFSANEGFRKKLTQKLSAELAGIKRQMDALPKEGQPDFAAAKDALIEKVGQDKYNMYQTMQTLGFAATHPDKVPQYLIAECRSKTDMLEAFLLLKVMESVSGTQAKDKVEIVNLVEHPDLVTDKGQGTMAARMTSGALDNPQFREHHLSINRFANMLTHVGADGKAKRLNVAEAKRAFGIQVHEGDEGREVAGVKIMMGAGSDVTKAGGSAAAAAMSDAVEGTRAALLNRKDSPVLLIDYIGCGGGVHRTQPVSTSFETVQGQSMRQLPENIGQKVIGNLTGRMLNYVAMNPDGEHREQGTKPLALNMSGAERRELARVNMGNLAGLAQNKALWNARTKDRTYAMMEKYGTLYNSPEFAELVSFSGNMFADMTKFAARPSDRVGAPKKPKGFLAPVSVTETRAIGFGAALNVAGIYAPLYYGGSEYLKESGSEGKGALREMYLYDPKAQDTINRMTYGVIMADMDVAWKYLGRDRAPSDVELKLLASQQFSGADGNQPLTVDERKRMAEKSLADINIEYNNVARNLLDLHRAVAGQGALAGGEVHLSGREAADAILNELPPTLSEQLSLSREHIKAPREALAGLFAKMLKGEVDPDSVNKNAAVYKNTIYPAMAAIFECTEHVPRSYSRPDWVRAVMASQQQGR